VLAHAIRFDPGRDEDIFAAVAVAPAVFILRGHDSESEPYVGKTANLRRRLVRLLSKPEERTKRLNLRERVATIEYSLTGSDFESGFLLYQTLRQEFPKTYANRLRLRPAPLIRFILENEYPRISVTARITTLRGRSLYYGPFSTRAAAEKFSNDALDFFNLRRCTDDLHPDPSFPGCMYSEMKMCLAPCFKGCTDDEYRREVQRVQAFLDTGGQSLKRELEQQREQASSDLDFERAAAVHARIEKLSAVLTPLPEIVTRIDQLNGVIIQPSAERDSVALFRIEAGRMNGPVHFQVQQNPAEGITADSNAKDARDAKEAKEAKTRPLSMEARFMEALAAVLPLDPSSAQETMEQLAYIKRWYYRSNKTGEVFFTDEKRELPMRRIVRGLSRVFRGEKASGELNETTRDYWVNRGKAAVLNPDNYNV
jgi:excinuclease ABC subunit C